MPSISDDCYSKCALCQLECDLQLVACEACQFDQSLCQGCSLKYMKSCHGCAKVLCPNHRLSKANCECTLCQNCYSSHDDIEWRCNGCQELFCEDHINYCIHQSQLCSNCHTYNRHKCWSCDQICSCVVNTTDLCQQDVNLCSPCQKQYSTTETRTCHICYSRVCLLHETNEVSKHPCFLCRQFFCLEHSPLLSLPDSTEIDQLPVCLACRSKVRVAQNVVCMWLYNPDSNYVKNTIKAHFEQLVSSLG